ncbi:MAG: phosphoenolpyruvate carboxykinase (ATP) [Nitrosopumilus sp.]|nr:phosphoenolpyruvate carboxykinase (ATP) [Nitrosopumilus sp.]CAI9831263.1 phosphoenolpyruvate carboxykinase [Nitrosopumilaceae archaeon]MDA7941892.1 phosphoenolpyruvate carboxykinase (ATP) [Nitrosopumilus sp.]MDA7943467.1 phosphoenolpyruvate carboxykinase (ATP) [Nitrosopumilus sp.]MDA7945453.1 phosphoenolpyruvate carboxykinase (ATP) [Nitrosopumilus sp.]
MTTGATPRLGDLGIRPGAVHRNLPPDDLARMSVERGEGVVSSTGALAVSTGKYTGRSPEDRFIVEDDSTRDAVDWGRVNRRFDAGRVEGILGRMASHLEGSDLFVFDGFVGADPSSRLPLRVVNDRAWQSMFASNMFIRPSADELQSHEPGFTMLCINGFSAVPERDGTRSDVFILIDMVRKLALIGGTSYAGEMKKAMFSVMNFLLPGRGVLPMHCSANVGGDGRTALFFGLSGTGKTTLSADPARRLIGDDEHGWSDAGVFNFEGGCYAKCIGLSREDEPEIWGAIRRGAVLENVVLDGTAPDYADNSLTENTRVAYPLSHIPGAAAPSTGGHPDVIIFLTADALGVLPPVSRLSREGAMYHFMSGYTSKLAGTERGIKEPKSVFSECFGAPFMPRRAQEYAAMLGERIDRHGSSVYLVNTGWSGGPYGVGKRMSIRHSRLMVSAAVSGSLGSAGYRRDSTFNLDVPVAVEGVPPGLLDPRSTWGDGAAYDEAAAGLARMFADNFARFGGVAPEITAAGPAAR